MKRKILAILLISILILSGCESTKEDTVASAAGFVPKAETQGAEELKKEPEILPSEQPKEEKKEPSQGQEQQTKEEEQQTKEEEQQPAEQEQKQPEEQQPVRQEQKQPEEEQPAEEELKLNFVKFWENVEEMSLEEANGILIEKFKHPNERLTDEERMALYVRIKHLYFGDGLASAVYAEKRYEHPGNGFIFRLNFEDEFTQKLLNDEGFLKLISWESQPFSKGYTDWSNTDLSITGFPNWDCSNEFYAKLVGTDNAYLYPCIGALGMVNDFLEKGNEIEFEDKIGKTISVYFRPYLNEQRCLYTDDKTSELFLECLKFYLSMEPLEVVNTGVFCPAL